MSFVHEDPEFDDLLQIVAGDRHLGVALVEKDYWVTHTLWALHERGFEVWFKGGTSLSKGFGLIERFSEDLDLKLEPGKVTSVAAVANWTSQGSTATKQRQAHFGALLEALNVPGAVVTPGTLTDPTFRSANFHVTYPGRHLPELEPVLSPFVLLEIGSARVTPAVPRDMTSFVHEYLLKRGQLDHFRDNRPRSVRCVHPLVTLLEKLDAITKRMPSGAAPATFVRHFEDAAHIVQQRSTLPPLPDDARVQELAAEMLDRKQIRAIPTASLAALTPDGGEQWTQVRRAHEAIHPMFWGSRRSLEDACAILRSWIAEELP